MKLPCPDTNQPSTRGYFLLELLVYMGLLVVIFGLATTAYWRCFDNSKRLDQNAAQILQAVEAGERWRGDVRAAQNVSADGDLLTLVLAGDTVEYHFDQQSVWRHSARSGQTVCLLKNVGSSTMKPDRRQQLTAWRWEIEFATAKEATHCPPAFHL